MPAIIQNNHIWARLEDEIYCRGLLSGLSGREKWEIFHNCSSPQDWFDFAATCFPAHQQKHEILEFLSLASMINPRIVLEIGTAQSGTNFLIGQVLESIELLIAMDLRVRNLPLLSLFSRPDMRRVSLEGSSQSRSTFEQLAQTLSGKLLDVLFIDGDHSYEGVSADYYLYRPLVRKGGFIAFHDVVEDHQTRYGRPSIGWAGGVPKFWKEILDSKDFVRSWEFISSPEQDGMGIGVLMI